MSTAFKRANIMIPTLDEENMEKWSVVACDQYTSEPDYWAETEKNVGDSNSTLRLILPEIYLEEDNVDARIEKIHKDMDKYLNDNIFEEYNNSYVYVERMTSDGVRQGIVGMIDLEEYDYHKGSKSQVRATEATVIERIPPRIKIRNNAPLELPHIMILIDDPKKTVVEPLANKLSNMKKLYDFDLMQKGGHIKGYLVDDSSANEIEKALDMLADKTAFNNKYGFDNEDVLLYAMGDGNHSLATAKEYYEKLKRENPGKDFSSHPARYALVEIVNLHSEALKFEAIHRIITGVDTDKIMNTLNEKLGLSETDNNGQSFVVYLNNDEKKYYITKPVSNLTVGSLQSVLDEYLSENEGKIDYIHGFEVVKKLSEAPNSIGFILPDMAKEELFPTVIKDGALPRKTFSMGHAWDKRYYTECRKIK